MNTMLKIGAAAVALSLMTTASAFAQADQSAAAPAAQAGATTPGAMAQAPMSANAAETANTPAGSPPSTYPPCKTKGEDRCMQEASTSGSHHMKHHTMKAKKTTDASTDSSAAPAPATPPAPGQ